MSEASTNVSPPAAPLTRSPWLIVLESTTGKITLITALIGAVGALIEKSFGLLKGASPWSIAGGIVIALFAGIVYVREVRRIRAREVRRPVTVFIGADSFTEEEKVRFFGREDEIEKVSRKLIQPHLRFFILSGKSGCGKTSLIRAGLIPELKEKYGYFPIYIRLYNRPEKYVREALQALSPPSPDGATLDEGRGAVQARTEAGSPGSLLNYLQTTRKLVGKPLLLFIDQFEEFFTNSIDENEREGFLTLVRSCVADDSNRHTKLVFSVRSDFLDEMALFDNYVDEPFKKESRVRLEMFDRKLARDVIKLSLDYARRHDNGLPWTDALIDRVLDDLEVTRRDVITNDVKSIILPAELQIVCQMIQAQRLSEAGEYPGKETLIRRYIEDAIETSPKPNATERVLIKLVNDNGVTRAEPQSPLEMAERLKDIDADLVGRILEYLAVPCRIAGQSLRRRVNGSGNEVVYELAHEYLARVITKLGEKVIDATRHANLLLDEYRKRLASTPRLLIPIKDSWHIRRHATEPIDAEMVRALRRSEKVFLFQVSGIVLVPVLAITAVRYGTVHFAVKFSPYANSKTKVVVERGLPILQPLLGSERVVVDSGFSVDDLSAEGLKSCQQQSWDLDLWLISENNWARRLSRWRVDKLQEQLNSKETFERVAAAHGLINLGMSDERVVNVLLAALAEGELSESSQAAGLLAKLNVPKERVLKPLLDRLARAFNSSERFELETVGRSLTALKYRELEVTELLLDGLSVNNPPEEEATKIRLIGDVGVNNERAVTSLLQVFNETERGYRHNDHIKAAAASLRKLGANEPRVIEALLASLKKETNGEVVREVVDTLIQFGVKDDRVMSSLAKRLYYRKDDSSLGSSVTLPIDRRETGPVVCDINIAARILRLNPGDEPALNCLLEELKEKELYSVDGNVFGSHRQYVVGLWHGLNIKDERAIASMFEILRGEDANPFLLPQTVETLQELDVPEGKIAEVLVSRLSGDQERDAVLIAPAFSRLHIKDARIKALLPLLLDMAEAERGNLPRAGEGLNDLAADTYARLELQDSAGDFNGAINRLWQLLTSTQAEQNTGYRRTFQSALALLAQQQVKNRIPDEQKIEAIREKVRPWLYDIYPHHRIAANEILDRIDTLVEKASVGESE